MIKKYRIDWDWKAELDVEVDHTIATEETFKEINEFWSGAAHRASRHGGHFQAALKMLAERCFMLQLESGWNVKGVVSEFDWDEGGGQEGWPKMDGSSGIKILAITVDVFDHADMEIKDLG